MVLILHENLHFYELYFNLEKVGLLRHSANKAVESSGRVREKKIDKYVGERKKMKKENEENNADSFFIII